MIRETFGARLRRVRLGAGLSQQALATASGTSRSLIASYEGGRRRLPGPRTVRRLAQALGVQPHALLDGVDLLAS